MPKYEGDTKFQLQEYPWSGWKAMSVESRKKEEQNKIKKVSENNGQIRFCPPPRVVHTSRLDQKIIENIGQLCFLQHSREGP